jgi:mono/diheme cytochrome c family protein
MMRRRTVIWVGSVALALLVVGSVAVWPLMLCGGRADPTDAAQVALGKTVYAGNCVSCHGANLEGQPDWGSRKADGRMPAPPHDATGHTWHHPDDVLVSVIKKGLEKHTPPGYGSDMPAFGGVLTDEQIGAVLAYLKSSWPPEVQERQSGLKQQSKN